MITIKPCLVNEKILDYLKMKNDDNLIYMVATENDEILGASAIKPYGEIYKVYSEFDFMYDGLIKAIISFFDRRNVKEITCKDTDIYKYLQKVGFKEINNQMFINTDDFFNNNC